MTVTRDIHGLAVAQRVLKDPRSTDRALRAALADTLRIVAVLQANWMEDMRADRETVKVLSRMLADVMEPEIAAYRPRKPKLTLVQPDNPA